MSNLAATLLLRDREKNLLDRQLQQQETAQQEAKQQRFWDEARQEHQALEAMKQQKFDRESRIAEVLGQAAGQQGQEAPTFGTPAISDAARAGHAAGGAEAFGAREKRDANAALEQMQREHEAQKVAFQQQQLGTRQTGRHEFQADEAVLNRDLQRELANIRGRWSVKAGRARGQAEAQVDFNRLAQALGKIGASQRKNPANMFKEFTTGEAAQVMITGIEAQVIAGKLTKEDGLAQAQEIIDAMGLGEGGAAPGGQGGAESVFDQGLE